MLLRWPNDGVTFDEPKCGRRPCLSVYRGVSTSSRIKRTDPTRKHAEANNLQPQADEAFVTGTGAELMPIAIADGRPLAGNRPGPITQRLTAAFHALVRNEGQPLW